MSSKFITVIHSIPSSGALEQSVLCHYQIDKLQSCRLLKRGLNDTYLIETEQKQYILRVYRHSWRTKEEIDFELELLNFLYKANVAVSYPLEKRTGGFITAIAAPEGTRYTALFSYAPGKVVDKKINSEQSRKLGETVATIHQATDNFKSSFNRPELNSEYLLDSSINAIAPLYKHRKNDIDYLYKQAENLKNNLIALDLPNCSPFYGICIGDVHAGNTHFNQLNQPTLFDFDQCGYGWRVFDIGKFINTAIVWKLESKIISSFLEGYQTIRQLNEIELRAIPMFTKIAHIWVMGISASVVGDVLPYGWFTDDWLDNKLELFKQLSD
ncbi:phosphotransferase [Synechocystis sp. PCC 7509]|uniref:phosphotransferase n=1 Tax=Synechocystis sp. PCC 7509 TaxID=927677 RepID=UPI0002AC906F|nr:phosphotransferase [Synechocystis sp. PCC 7509]